MIGLDTKKKHPAPNHYEKFHQLYTVDEQSGCWNWQGHKGNHGYGLLAMTRGRQWTTHRLAWEFYYGEIPKGLCVCHACDNRACVNPAHLFLGTLLDNIDDMNKKGRHAKGATAKLTFNQVREIFGADGTQRELANRFSISPTQIHAIKKRKEWRWATWDL